MSVDYVQARKQLQDNRYKHMGTLVGLVVCGVMSLGSFFFLMLTNANDHPLNSVFALIVYMVATFMVVVLVMFMVSGVTDGVEADDGE